MQRRDFITGIASAVAVCPLAARAQQRAVPIIGLLSSRALYDSELAAVRNGLSEFGFVPGKTVEIDYRSAHSDFNQLAVLADEFVSLPVSVIIAVGGTPSAQAAKKATPTIPIVFANGSDPVKIGLVASLNQPGGNITGVTFLASTFGAKQIQLLHEVIPNANSIGALVNPYNPNAKSEIEDILTAAHTLALRVDFENVSTAREMERSVERLVQLPVQGLMCVADAFFADKGELLVSLASQYRLPTIVPEPRLVTIGALMSYSSFREDAIRMAASYAGRILKGEKPANLPVQEATKIELAINLKTAKTLGITFPLSVLGRADEVIE